MSASQVPYKLWDSFQKITSIISIISYRTVLIITVTRNLNENEILPNASFSMPLILDINSQRCFLGRKRGFSHDHDRKAPHF